MSIDGMTVEGTVELLISTRPRPTWNNWCGRTMKTPRQLPAWLLYDSEGSRLFTAICEQPSTAHTQRNQPAEPGGRRDRRRCRTGVLVEFGIGNARKVSPLLKALNSDLFVGLDISRSALRDALHGLGRAHPQTTMLGICCDHSQLTDLPRHPRLDGQRRIGFFPGSSLGNFNRDEAVALLQRFRQLLNGGPLLLGLDQPRDPALLEAAYDDAAGVSAAFARNLLIRLNRDLQGDIDPSRFRYRLAGRAPQAALNGPGQRRSTDHQPRR